MIGIVDYGLGNLASVTNMLRRVGASSILASRPEEIGRADKLILPGVGAFDHGMARLEATGLLDALNERVLEARVPVLGLCLGMQLFTRGSEEGRRPGLGWLPAETRRLQPADSRMKVPHMGWADVRAVRAHPLLQEAEPELRFYFVHSYHVVCDDRQSVVAEADHGLAFCAVACAGNIMGVQFHPEKSHRFGMKLLRNFVEM